ncbi:proton-coupled zinc antiporter SLC30A9, mitochondrial [Cloeon dipterum]|uniref:proton-coupled zinc antiporter SLC30A9, mitochondrial n=1 Tax=Cloeon dipterum TaxID=197152 RepID=UPI0032202F85
MLFRPYTLVIRGLKSPIQIVLHQPKQKLTTLSIIPLRPAKLFLRSQICFSRIFSSSTEKPVDDVGNEPKPEEKVTVKLKEVVAKALPKRRQRVDSSATSLERNFVTPLRAMNDFLLKQNELDELRKIQRRSPFENEPPITVYWRRDIEAKAMEVWGSKENLQNELVKRDAERRRYQQNIFTVKRVLRDYRREQRTKPESVPKDAGLMSSTGKVVLTAVIINASNFLFKLFAWLYTGSHSMFSECIHSFADTANQLILCFGIHKSVQRADMDHPYGYSNMRYVSSLISGVGIFCVGTGLSLYHGITGLMHPQPTEPFFWAFFILGGSMVSEGATLLVAVNSIKKGARETGMTFTEYVLRGQDPSVNVVLLEDLAAVLGVAIAGTCMGLTVHYGSHIPDAVGSLLVGGLLGTVASFIIYTNTAALVGRSIPQERIDKINAELESDVMVRAIHDVKGIDMGNSLVRYKAEIDFDGGELARSYLDKQELSALLEEMQRMTTIEEVEAFVLKHGENIVDMLGAEIDRIETKLRKKHPEIRHCDLEVL